MKYMIRYKCSYPECKEIEECEEGFYANLSHKHEDAEGKEIKWYPVQITEVYKK